VRPSAIELRSIVQAILTSLLELVVGGAGSTTTTEAPFYKRTTTTSDYKACVDQVVKSTTDQYPSTASWWNPWSTDTNAGPRAKATVDNMRSTCGLPPAN
jgi:hypothetical protein